MVDLSGQNKFTTALSDHSYVSLKLCSFMFIYMFKVILVNSTPQTFACTKKSIAPAPPRGFPS